MSVQWFNNGYYVAKCPDTKIYIEHFCEKIMNGTYDKNNLTCSDLRSGSLDPAKYIECAYGTSLRINGIDSQYKQDLEYYLGCQFDIKPLLP